MEPKRNRIIAATGFAVALLILGGNVAVISAGNGTAEDTQSTVARPRTKTEPGCRRPRHTGIIHSPAAIARDRVHRLSRVHGAAGGDMRRIHRAGGILGA